MPRGGLRNSGRADVKVGPYLVMVLSAGLAVRLRNRSSPALTELIPRTNCCFFAVSASFASFVVSVVGSWELGVGSSVSYNPTEAVGYVCCHPWASPDVRFHRRSHRKYATDPPVGFEHGLRNVELYAKAEWKNPGGSVKDRPAARMIADGERSGALTRNKILLDATSGNTGIAYAMIGAARGYRVRLCVPENVTPERKRILKAFGAEIVFTDPMEGSDGAILRAKKMFAENPDLYFYPDQVQQPRQLAVALRHDRSGDHRADRRPSHAFRSRPWHQRDVRRRRPAAAGVQSLDQADFRPARFAAARPRRAEAHGDGHRSRHLRRDDCR